MQIRQAQDDFDNTLDDLIKDVERNKTVNEFPDDFREVTRPRLNLPTVGEQVESFTHSLTHFIKDLFSIFLMKGNFASSIAMETRRYLVLQTKLAYMKLQKSMHILFHLQNSLLMIKKFFNECSIHFGNKSSLRIQAQGFSSHVLVNPCRTKEESFLKPVRHVSMCKLLSDSNAISSHVINKISINDEKLSR